MESGTGDPVWHPESPDARVAVIAALELEAVILRRAFANTGPDILVSGPGAGQAGRAASRALDRGANALVSWGLAGGLQADAGTGSVVLPEVVASDSGRYAADPAWRERIVRLLGQRYRILPGAVFTADRVLTTTAEKAALRERTGAAAVDMESAGVAAVAAAARVPFIAIRAVADTAADTLPARVAELVTDDGRTRLAALPPILLAPRQFARLLRLGLRSREARRVLRRIAALLAGAGP